MSRTAVSAAKLVAWALATIAVTASAPSTGHAQVISVVAASRGFVEADNSSDAASASANYIVGNVGVSPSQPGYSGAGEARDFFQFSLPTFSGVITQAQLVIGTVGVGLAQSSPLTYTVTTTGATLAFNQLGTGQILGAETYASTDVGTTKSISLDPALIQQAISPGGLLTLSGRVTSPTTFLGAAPEEEIFGGSQDSVLGPNTVELSLTISAVPEPSKGWLMIIGLAFMARRVSQDRCKPA